MQAGIQSDMDSETQYLEDIQREEVNELCQQEALNDMDIHDMSFDPN
jgi:hypothetical protein